MRLRRRDCDNIETVTELSMSWLLSLPVRLEVMSGHFANVCDRLSHDVLRGVTMFLMFLAVRLYLARSCSSKQDVTDYLTHQIVGHLCAHVAAMDFAHSVINS